MTSNSDACGFRQSRECGCASGSCRVQPTPVPLIQPSRLSTLAVVSFGLVMACIAFLALSEADRQFKKQFLDNQENVHVHRR